MSHDAIVLGAGHNGLTTAALLGQAGKKVLVVEARDRAGGLASSREFHPGYRAPGVLHDTGSVRDWVIQKLALTSHGLQRRQAPTPVFAPEVDGRGILLSHDAAQMQAELSARSGIDADGYVSFRAFIDQVSGFVRSVLDEPPPDLLASGLREVWPMVTKGVAMRRLGRRTMMDLLRITPLSAVDWLREWFDDELLKAMVAAPGLAGTWLGPRSAGSAALTLISECTRQPEIAGGPPALVRALLAACEAHGVEIRTHAPVRRITVNNGAVTGVELDGGEQIEAATGELVEQPLTIGRVRGRRIREVERDLASGVDSQRSSERRALHHQLSLEIEPAGARACHGARRVGELQLRRGGRGPRLPKRLPATLPGLYEVPCDADASVEEDRSYRVEPRGLRGLPLSPRDVEVDGREVLLGGGDPGTARQEGGHVPRERRAVAEDGRVRARDRNIERATQARVGDDSGGDELGLADAALGAQGAKTGVVVDGQDGRLIRREAIAVIEHHLAGARGLETLAQDRVGVPRFGQRAGARRHRVREASAADQLRTQAGAREGDPPAHRARPRSSPRR